MTTFITSPEPISRETARLVRESFEFGFAAGRASATPDVDGLIAFLNSLLAVDRAAVTRLVDTRVPCNPAMAAHPTVQVAVIGFQQDVGMLGILNGYCGTIKSGPRAGWGHISARCEENGTILRFERTPE